MLNPPIHYADIIHNSPQWDALRIGKITSSTFEEVLTPVQHKLSESAVKIENRIVYELITGKSSNTFGGNYHTERGHALEADAVKMYELVSGVETKRGGFFTDHLGRFGCSPDRLIGEDGGLEIKCLMGENSVSMLFEKNIAVEHRPQVQGMLWITGRKWWDVMSYNPDLPPSIIRVTRDHLYISKLETALIATWNRIDTKIRAIKEMQK